MLAGGRHWAASNHDGDLGRPERLLTVLDAPNVNFAIVTP